MRICLLSIIALSFVATAAVADPAAEKSIGIGLGVGVATGPNLQVATTRDTQLDLGFGYELDSRLRLQADYAWRFVDLSSSRAVALPIYLGVGGFVTDYRAGYADGGLRMPLGLQADFARAPIQLFGEVAPELVLVQSYDRMDVPVLGLSGLAGVRAAF